MQTALRQDGYAVDWVRDAESADTALTTAGFDLVLLDLGLPGRDGVSVCRELRRQGKDTAILMLTAKGQLADRVVGLKLGADDYVCKPFSPREVVARVKAVLRRAQPAVKDVVLKAGSIVLHEDTRNVTIGGRELRLTPNEFGLLRLLMANPGRVFSRGELVSRVLFKLGPQLEQHQISVKVDISQSLPLMLANEDRMEQVLTNLVENAIRYSPPGKTVTVKAGSDNGLVQIEVSDEGPGIPEEDLPYIWDRFHRVEKSRSRSLGGTGLGLAIVKQIVEAHGGKVGVHSQPGQGSTFFFSIPAVPAEN